MAYIFLLEDDPIIGKAVQLQMELEGHKVVWFQCISDAEKSESLPQQVDLFLLDVNLPDGSGFEFCEWLRGNDVNSPVIFLTARSDEDSVVNGFESGANDYMRKPFSPRELIMRIKNQLTEKKASLEILRFGGLSLIINQQILKNGDQMIPLNRRELEILSAFFEHPEVIISRDQLINRLSSGEEIFDRTVDSHISHIRSKLLKNGIANVRINSVYGQGYRMEKASA
ncbi:response regulator transcription factor [Bdellovibrio sp. HCB2-146]|uniref:response regulator transcription factor n=1 Tax=Bdellovibrio sp. HCB2-146 TaxID=3394362 RepID=UPI0039BC30E8